MSERDSGWSHAALDVASDAEERCTVSRAMGLDILAVSAVRVPIGSIAPGYERFPPCLLKASLCFGFSRRQVQFALSVHMVGELNP